MGARRWMGKGREETGQPQGTDDQPTTLTFFFARSPEAPSTTTTVFWVSSSVAEWPVWVWVWVVHRRAKGG